MNLGPRVLIALVLSTACGAEGTDQPTPSPSPTPSPTASPTPSPTPTLSPSPSPSPTPTPWPAPSTELAGRLSAILAGDRSAACAAAAIVDLRAGAISAVACADGEAERRTRALTTSSAMELGSISKTLVGVLFADLERRGVLGLDDALTDHLPPGTGAPSFLGQPIRLRHVLTHTSGLPRLPSRLTIVDPADPYASLTEAALLGSLADVTLAVAPGTTWDYSNFGFMLLSWIAAQHAHVALDEALRTRLWAPLGMSTAHLGAAPRGVHVAEAHLPGGLVTPRWTFAGDLGGVGGVRASVDDMARYLGAALGRGDLEAVAAMARAGTPIGPAGVAPQMGFGWILIPSARGLQWVHDGGTGGSSTLAIVEPDAGRAVIVLLDTAQASTNLATELALHLFAPDAAPAPTPRRPVVTPPELLGALPGRYTIAELGVTLELVARGDALFLRVAGEADQPLRADDHGDLYTDGVDALLHVEQSGGRYTLWYVAGGASYALTRRP